VLLEPGEERAHGPVIGHAGVVVLDRGGKKIEEPARRAIPGVGDHRRHGKRTEQVDVVTGAAASTTAGTLRRSALTATPYR
jgi:hypothetical protein